MADGGDGEWRATTDGSGAVLVQRRVGGRWCRWTQVRPSPVHGRGLFADRAFRPGDEIGWYDGLELHPACVPDYESSMVMELQEPVRRRPNLQSPCF